MGPRWQARFGSAAEDGESPMNVLGEGPVGGRTVRGAPGLLLALWALVALAALLPAPASVLAGPGPWLGSQHDGPTTGCDRPSLPGSGCRWVLPASPRTFASASDAAPPSLLPGIARESSFEASARRQRQGACPSRPARFGDPHAP